MLKNKYFYLVSGGVIVLVIITMIILLSTDILYPTREYGRTSLQSQRPAIMSELDLVATEKSKIQNEPVPSKPTNIQNLKIIKTAEIKYRVLNYRKSRTNIENIIKTFQAYVASENEQNVYNSIENTMRIRVAAAKFDQLVEALLKESISMDYKSIQTQDVTTEFIDNGARLKAKREVEGRYLAILKKANNVKDILEVENQLGQIREAIESTEGQLKYLNDQVNYSTITLIFYQTLERLPQTENSFLYRVGEAFVKGWNALLALLIGIINLWPFILVVAGGIWFYRRFFHKKSKNTEVG